MDPGGIPVELQVLGKVEDLLVARVCPIMRA